jgi:histone H2A
LKQIKFSLQITMSQEISRGRRSLTPRTPIRHTPHVSNAATSPTEPKSPTPNMIRSSRGTTPRASAQKSPIIDKINTNRASTPSPVEPLAQVDESLRSPRASTPLSQSQMTAAQEASSINLVVDRPATSSLVEPNDEPIPSIDEHQIAVNIDSSPDNEEEQMMTETINEQPTTSKTKSTTSKKKRKTKSKKAGIIFPVGRMHRQLKEGRFAKRISEGASVYMASVLEYLCAEVLELAGNAARDNRKKRIIPRHVQLAIRNDAELDKLLNNVTISQGGVVPFVHSSLLPKEKSKKTDRE